MISPVIIIILIYNEYNNLADNFILIRFMHLGLSLVNLNTQFIVELLISDLGILTLGNILPRVLPSVVF